MTSTQWLNAAEQRSWRSYIGMKTALDRLLELKLGEDCGLSTADLEVLVPLSEAPDRRLRARDLGLAMTWDRSRLSHHIRRMEQRGLVERTSCPEDARGTVIALTAEGWRTIDDAAPAHVRAVREAVFDVLTRRDRADLERVCRKISERIEQLGLPSTCAEAPSCGAEDSGDTCDSTTTHM